MENAARTTMSLPRLWPFPCPAPLILWRGWFTPTSKNGAENVFNLASLIIYCAKGADGDQVLGKPAATTSHLNPEGPGQGDPSARVFSIIRLTACNYDLAHAHLLRRRESQRQIDTSGLIRNYPNQSRTVCTPMEQCGEGLSWVEE